MTVKEAVELGKNKLNTQTPLLDAQVLLMYCAGRHNLALDKVKLYTEPDLVLNEKIISFFMECIERRRKKEPVQYITGICEFMGMEFEVNRNTLIPRTDTEILVENAIEYIKENKINTVLDMCTGSGAVAVSVCAFCGNIKMTAADISEEAVNTAKINAKKNNTVNIDFYIGNLFEPIKNAKFDLILSNPPYIPKNVINTLEPNVKDYEPVSALDGGEDGLFFYREITDKARAFLNSKGRIYYEIGYNQSDDVSKILENNGFCNINTIKDLSGLDRVVYADY